MTGAAGVLRVYGALCGITSVGVVAGAFAGGARPASFTDRTGGPLFVDVLATNTRLVAAIALAALMVAAVPVWRPILDVVVAALLATNALAIGAAIGAAGLEVANWLAHVPFEWAGLAAAGASYLDARREPTGARRLAGWALGALALVVAGAGVEAWGPRLG